MLQSHADRSVSTWAGSRLSGASNPEAPHAIGYQPLPGVVGFGVDLATILWLGPNLRWGPGQYTFSIPVAGSSWSGYQNNNGEYGSEPFLTGSRVLTAFEAQVFRDAFRVWDDLIAPDFTETDDLTNPGNIRIAYVAPGRGNHAYGPSNVLLPTTAQSGDIWIGAGPGFGETLYGTANDRNFYHYNLNHEISHALGLNHPFDSVGFNRVFDNTRYTVASYTHPSDGVWFSFSTSGSGWSSTVRTVRGVAPMVMDIAAVQALYGADPDTRAGDNVYVWDDRGMIFESIYDAGGTDTFDLSQNRRGSVVDLTPGAYSSISRLADIQDLARFYIETNPTAFTGPASSHEAAVVSQLTGYGPDRLFFNQNNLGIAFTTVIENVIGSRFADHISGNHANNIIRSGAGDDTLFGYEGDDILEGGAGNDYLDGGLGANTAVFSGPRSAYTIAWNGQIGTVTGPDGVDTITNITRLQFSDQMILTEPSGGLNIRGGAASNVMNGGSLNDTFHGMAGDDTLNGGDGDDSLNGGEGTDFLNGGAGLDTADYRGASGGVSVNLGTGQVLGAAGLDTLISIENVTGSEWNDTLVGDAGANVMSGAGGSDLIYGGGGNDRLVAGAPNVDAPTVVKPQTRINRDIASAVSLDGAFDLRTDAGIFRSTEIPHATVQGSAHGQGYEYFSFAVRRGDTIIVDMDLIGSSNLLFPGIDVFDSAGNAISLTQRLSDVDPYAFQLTATFDGTMYVRLGKPGPEVGGNPSDPRPGQTYVLNVSVSSQTIDPAYNQGSELYGETGNDILVSGSGNDVLDGGQGLDTAVFGVRFSDARISTQASGDIIVTSSEGRDLLRGVEVLQFADGVHDVGADGRVADQARMALTGDGSANTLVGGSSNDRLSGNAGNDTLRGAGGNDLLDGGTGFDTALYSGLRRQYVASSTSVSGNGEGTDTLSSIESARFVDGVLSFDADSAYAQVARLFDAVLDRLPDQAGLEFQANALLSGGLTLLQLTDNFIQSAEFQARFGGLSNAAFIDNLFRFSLGRPGDAAGIQAWVEVLDAGASRASVVMSFSESPEHRLQLTSFVNAGMWIPDAEALMIARLYDAAFERAPDPAGLAAWLAALESGAPLLQVAATFAASPEFQLTYGSLTNQQFVEQIYRACLDREGDAAGVQAWTTVLDQGATRAQVLVSFSESPEHVNLTAPQWSGGIRYLGYSGAAPVEDVGGKDAAPQVSPLMDDAMIYHPADLGLTGEQDAFVPSRDPDGGMAPWSPSDDHVLAPTAPAPMAAADLLAVMPDESITGWHRDHLDLAWA